MPLLPSPCDLLARRFVPVLRECASSLGADIVADFGPVFLPPVAGLSLTREHAGTRRAEGGFPLAVSCFALSRLAPEELPAHLDALYRSSRFVLLADFKVAERNIEAPACLLAGSLRRFGAEHPSAFEAFTGLEGLLYAERERFAVKERFPLLGGALLAVLAEALR